MRRPSPTVTIASIALFFSLAGTGLAASKYLITSTSQIKPSLLKALRRVCPVADGGPSCRVRSDSERLDQLARLHELHKAGALSAQEFEAEKRRLLSSVDESASVTQPAPAEN